MIKKAMQTDCRKIMSESVQSVLTIKSFKRIFRQILPITALKNLVVRKDAKQALRTTNELPFKGAHLP